MLIRLNGRSPRLSAIKPSWFVFCGVRSNLNKAPLYFSGVKRGSTFDLPRGYVAQHNRATSRIIKHCGTPRLGAARPTVDTKRLVHRVIDAVRNIQPNYLH